MSFEPPHLFNIADYFLWDRLENGDSDRIAIQTTDREWTYREVAELSDRFGFVLRRTGHRQEERVMIALPDGPSWVGAFFGTLKVGGVVIMVNPGLKSEQLAALFDYTRASTLFVHGDFLPLFEDALSAADWKPNFIVVEGPPGKHASYGDQQRHFSGELKPAETHRDDPAIWLFSGGTTGTPKAVVQSHRSFANTTELYAKGALKYQADDVTLSVPKLFFGYATGSNLLFPFAVGASTVLFPEHPTPEILFDYIERFRPTILVNVPTMVNKMVNTESAKDHDLSCLRFATSAGEALPPPLYQRWLDTFGAPLLDGIGTAEMWHIFITNLPEKTKPGTLGTVVPGFEVEIRDAEGQPVPDGEIGKMWVRGDSRATAYWQNMEKTAEAFVGPWFVGGDLISRDADGFITYCGRGDDAMKVAGKWFTPQEVESCLMRHEAVAECAVVALENEDGLIKPIAFVVPKDEARRAADPTLSERLKQHVLDHLDAYKHPRRVILVEDFPRTHLGKVDRGKLREMA